MSEEAMEGASGRTALGPLVEVMPGGSFPDGHESVLNPFVVSQMLYSHAMALYNGSYDKGANSFAMTMEDSLEVATGLFLKSFETGLIRARFRNVAEKLLIKDLFPEIPAPLAAAAEGGALNYE